MENERDRRRRRRRTSHTKREVFAWLTLLTIAAKAVLSWVGFAGLVLLLLVVGFLYPVFAA